MRPQRIDVGAEVLSEFAVPAIELLAPLVRDARFDSASTTRAPASADSAGMRAFRDTFSAHRRTAAGCAPVGPRHTRAVVVGQFDDRAVLSTIARAFGGWQNEGERAIDPIDPESSVLAPQRLILIDRPGAKQSAILVGAAVYGDAPFRVADAILGANVVSRITMNIREAKGYAYSPTSVLMFAPSGGTTWVEIADVSTGVTAPALREILLEIKRLGAENPQTTEVDGAERYLLGRYLVETATRTGWADQSELVSAASDTRHFVGVTADSVRASVARWLAPRRLSIVVVGDTIALGDQMAAIHAMVDARQLRP